VDVAGPCFRSVLVSGVGESQRPKFGKWADIVRQECRRNVEGPGNLGCFSTLGERGSIELEWGLEMVLLLRFGLYSIHVLVASTIHCIFFGGHYPSLGNPLITPLRGNNMMLCCNV
jgi:hypothetical protein